MTKKEVKRIAEFLSGIQGGFYERAKRLTMQLKIAELDKIIKILMDETFKAQDKGLKGTFAFLEIKARSCKSLIEKFMAVQN